MIEEWKELIEECPGFYISSFGNIKDDKGNIVFISDNYDKDGYPTYFFPRDKVIGFPGKKIHRLVAKYFVDNPNGYNEVNHIDGNTINNCAENLEWCSHLHNMRHAYDNGKISHEFERGNKNKKSKPVYQKTKDGNIINVWESVNQIQRETNYLASGIFCCCNHRKNYKTAYGYVWEYVNDGDIKNQN